MRNNKALNNYLKKNALNYEEIEMTMESLRTKFGLEGVPQDAEPLVDTEVKKEKKKVSVEASDIASEIEALKEMSDTKITKEEAAKDFFENICKKTKS